MSSSLILSVLGGSVAFGEKVIFDDLTFHVQEGDKICLVGRNGAGKSTLMNIVTGDLDLDSGERWMLQGTRIGYLKQEIIPVPGQTVEDFVFEMFKGTDEEELHKYKVDMIVRPLELDPAAHMDKLSGGQLRRASLAQVLVEEPEILLLDEPTNHLDLDVIEWLEKYLKQYRGALLCVSHDKTFLANISDKIFWLDRGRVRVCPKGFAHFDEWSGQLLEQEARELKNREKALESELEWAARSPGARRKRNIRRLEIVQAERARLKADKSSFRRMMARMELGELEIAESNSKIVAEFIKVDKHFGDKKILDKFSLRIQRGDRIGILGKNGSGKTTFLRLLTGELEPDMGKVKLARELEFSYFDQKRSELRYDDTVQRTLCPQGGEYVKVMNKTRHVCGYLKDFMFDPALAGQMVGTLSGGQKNRLMLAKVLADPKSLLILDEPTNDLDMDTLDMLEEILTDYTGTLLVVSHDRDFLDQTVTKIIAFEGDAKVEGYIGGYTDYLAAKEGGEAKAASAAVTVAAKKKEAAPPPPAPKTTKRLTFKLQHELERLPRVIERLEKEIAELEGILEDSDLYAKDKNVFHHASHRLGYAREELHEAENRWLELEGMRMAVES